MNKQSITFKADEQELIKTGGINNYASNIVAYIEATFELGENWTGYDSVRAVWSNDYLTDISTVLDPNGRCIVPTEVLTDTSNVTVNLVGSISVDDELTDRLTTYPCKALIVDEDAKVEGDETESITPSQFEQFVSIVHDEVEEVTGMSAEASTLPAGSDATASYSDGVLLLGIPQGIQGEQGEQGETGHTGEPAGFGDVTASVDNTVGTPSVAVHTSGPDTAKEFDFEFHNLKGDKGDTGDTGATGNGITSTVLNSDYTLTITFTDGTSYTTPSIRGAKGDTGNTGATGNGIQSTVLNADYTLTITFTDGTSYTTPSIRGEQGPAGPVSDVTVNGTSVVDQNGVAKILMPELIKTVNGNPIVLDDAFGEVKNLDVELLPIQAGTGTPSPQNIRPITGHDSVVVTDTGKNIFDDTDLRVGGGFWYSFSSTYTQRQSGVHLIKAYPNTTYTMSMVGGSLRFAIQEYENTSTSVADNPFLVDSGWQTSTYTFTTSANTHYMWLTFSSPNYSYDISASDVQACKYMLEYGNTATTYESYQSQSKTVTLPHTVYGGKPNITTGNGTETQVIIDLGERNYSITGGAFYTVLTDGLIKGYYGQNATEAYCDIYARHNNNPAMTGEDSVWCVGSNYWNGSQCWLAIKDTRYTTVADFKQAVSGHKFVYTLATPTDLSTTPTSLTLYNGDNVISSDGDMELSYVQDMAIVIEKLENLL